ncbi:MAG: enoyl-CoA hydratase/isomerase family protein [Lewinellaceae bacterium]|nr:enoyl-CoA hydratase/isomerase family protein [Phaeodactylibacter sp.]MCB0612934.1 enoyl-CoA hydratase/isomerase family protein [Phaeodactylibacter sp.]MCB9349958.1 enoyl-CoA hydratase/isomerase family protein [Lewinellaceae bacterium]
MEDNNTILFELDGHVARITLNRPQVYNSFNREMALALQSRLDQCKNDPQVRAIYLTGAGKAFSAGQDLQEIVAENGPEMTTILTEHYNPIIMRIREIEKPVVAAVNGVAAGAGANIALACDVVVAAGAASFIQAFSKIGLIPDSGGTFFLPRLVGFQKASALMMLGDKVSAEEAERLGMIYHCFPDEGFAEKSMEIARRLSLMPTRGLGYTKRALNQSLANNLEGQLTVEDELQSAAGQTEDYKEGVNAFLEKRKAVFKGK